MAVMLERWNDDRMDDLAGKVDEIGVQLREQGAELRQEMQTQTVGLRQEMQAQGSELRQEMQAQGREMRQEILELRRAIKFAAISVSSSALAGFAALLATQL